MNSTLLDELFTPYAEAVDNYNTCCDAYRTVQRAADDTLRKIERRQQAEKTKIISKIADLENEEKRLKSDIRQRIIKGESSADADLGTGARLAVISEQKAALRVLENRRCMTDAEKSLWEKAVDDLDEVTNSLNIAIAQRHKQTVRLQAYLKSNEYWGASVPNRSNESLFDKAYELNKDGGADDEEEN